MRESTNGALGRITIIILITALVLITGTCSCTSKSSKEMNTQPEKVVIIDALPNYTTPSFPTREYKVKRINKGVVVFITARKGYDIGDTILVKINN